MFAFVMDVPVAWETFARINDDLGDESPDGLVAHVAGPTDEGVRIIDIWETEEQFVRFRDEQLAPVVARHVAGAPERPQPVLRGARRAALHGASVRAGLLDD